MFSETYLGAVTDTYRKSALKTSSGYIIMYQFGWYHGEYAFVPFVGRRLFLFAFLTA